MNGIKTKVSAAGYQSQQRNLSHGEAPTTTQGGIGGFTTGTCDAGRAVGVLQPLTMEMMQWADQRGQLSQIVAAYADYYKASAAMVSVPSPVSETVSSLSSFAFRGGDKKKRVSMSAAKAKQMASSWWRPGEGPVEIGDSVSVASTVSSVATGVSASRYWVFSADEIDALGDGFCYMSVIAKDASEGVRKRLGAWPTLGELLSLEASAFIPVDLFKYRRVLRCGDVVHIGGKDGEVGFADFAETSGCLGDGLRSLGLCDRVLPSSAVSFLKVGGREPISSFAAASVERSGVSEYTRLADRIGESLVRIALRQQASEKEKKNHALVCLPEVTQVAADVGFDDQAELPQVAPQQGFCYLSLFNQADRAMAASVLGPDVEFQALVKGLVQYGVCWQNAEILCFRKSFRDGGRVWHVDKIRVEDFDCVGAVSLLTAAMAGLGACALRADYGMEYNHKIGGDEEVGEGVTVTRQGVAVEPLGVSHCVVDTVPEIAAVRDSVCGLDYFAGLTEKGHVKRVHSGDDLDLATKPALLVMFVNEKAMLMSRYPNYDGPIMTVAESQGQRFDHVVLFNFELRGEDHPEYPCCCKGHLSLVLSRARFSFTYVKETTHYDMLLEWMEKGKENNRVAAASAAAGDV